MFSKIKIKNIGVISDEIMIDFYANKRDVSNIDSIYAQDGAFANKVIGIIAGNSCGKTTVLEILKCVGSFLDFSFYSNKMKEYAMKELIGYKSEEFNEIYDYISKRSMQAYLLSPNKRNKGNSVIELEMYINTDYESTTGYYNYYLEYDDNYRNAGVLEESLYYRKKLNSKKVKEIFTLSGHKGSEIGYKLFFEQNLRLELQETIGALDEFDYKLKYYRAFFDHYVKDSDALNSESKFDKWDATYAIQKNKDYFEKVIKLADSNIKSISIVAFEKEKRLKFDYEGYSLDYADLSSGTYRLLEIANSILKVIKNDGVLLVDELENSLNLELAKNIVSIFQNLGEKSRAQLIFTTHNPELVNILRNDQIYLLQKDGLEVSATKYSNFISPVTHKKIRNDCSFVKAYKTDMIKNHPIDDIKNIINSI